LTLAIEAIRTATPFQTVDSNPTEKIKLFKPSKDGNNNGVKNILVSMDNKLDLLTQGLLINNDHKKEEANSYDCPLDDFFGNPRNDDKVEEDKISQCSEGIMKEGDFLYAKISKLIWKTNFDCLSEGFIKKNCYTSGNRPTVSRLQSVLDFLVDSGKLEKVELPKNVLGYKIKSV